MIYRQFSITFAVQQVGLSLSAKRGEESPGNAERHIS